MLEYWNVGKRGCAQAQLFGPLVHWSTIPSFHYSGFDTSAHGLGRGTGLRSQFSVSFFRLFVVHPHNPVIK